MNRFFRMYGAKLAFAVIALMLFAGTPEFGGEVEARPKARRATAKRVKGATKRYARAERGRRGRGVAKVRARGAKRYARNSGRRGGAYYGRRSVRTVRYVRVRGGRGRYRRVIYTRRGGRFYARSNRTVAANRTSVATAVSEPRAPRTVRSIQIPDDRAREIQAALKNAGYYQGDVTGQYDEGTREAMRNYQRANGLKETGTPTAPSLLKLGLTKHSSPAGDTSAPSVVPQAQNPSEKPDDENPK